MYCGSSYSSLGKLSFVSLNHDRKYSKWTFSLDQQDGSCCLWMTLSLAFLAVSVKWEDLLSCSCAICVEKQNKNASLGACVAKQGHMVLSADSCGSVGRAQFLAESVVSWI